MRLGRLKNLRLLCSVVIWHENLKVMVFVNSDGSGCKWPFLKMKTVTHEQMLWGEVLILKPLQHFSTDNSTVTTELFLLYNLMALFSPSGRCCLLTPRLQHWTRTAAAGTVHSSPVPCRVTVRCHLHPAAQVNTELFTTIILSNPNWRWHFNDPQPLKKVNGKQMINRLLFSFPLQFGVRYLFESIVLYVLWIKPESQMDKSVVLCCLGNK